MYENDTSNYMSVLLASDSLTDFLTRYEIVSQIIDYDRALLERRKTLVADAAAFLNKKYGKSTVVLDMADTYYNMAEQILPHPEILDLAKRAITALGGTPVSTAVRGGTDGSRLSFMGLPCPNLATGGRGAHGRFEYVSATEMELCTEVLLEIVRLAAL